MDSDILVINEESQMKIQLRTEIDSYVRHLSLPELKIIKQMAEILCKNYSDSYRNLNDPEYFAELSKPVNK
jgi:hypothetical protein